MAVFGVILAVIPTALLIFGKVGCNDPTGHYKKILNKLSQLDVTLIAPGEVDTQYRNVSLNLHLINIVEVNTKRRFLDATFYMDQRYTDPRLAWESSGTNKLSLPASRVWVPDFEVYEALAPVDYLTAREVIVYSDGTVLFIPSVRIKVPCQTSDNNNVTCSLNIGSWQHDSSVVDIASSELYLGDMLPNQSWMVVDSSAEIKRKTYSAGEEVYPSVSFTLKFQHPPRCEV